MIKLSGVSKYYYQKGMISSGISDVDLEFSLGEFIAITGESGSGKSTLLNVISGLDSYEEGEMYVNNEETSYFSNIELENYRKKYIGNIFQSFNLVNSYSVFKNIELVLLLRGKKTRHVKKRILEIIEFVGLTKFKNTKVSKLSGGQKQRVAIARVLAMDVPIILADEPTGNLDEKSAKEIIQLLSEISKDKLVIVVTHNFERIEPYITKKIVMADGGVLEEIEYKPSTIVEEEIIQKPKNISIFNTIRLAIRNTFNLPAKLILLLTVFAVITSGVMSQYSSYKEQNNNLVNMGYNYYFGYTEDDRIVVKRSDNLEFTDEDYLAIESLEGVKSIVKDDFLLDTQGNLNFNDYYFSGYLSPISNFVDQDTLVGRMPENDKEIVISIGIWESYFLENADEFLDSTTKIDTWEFGENALTTQYTVVGYAPNLSNNSYIYVPESTLTKLQGLLHRSKSTTVTYLSGHRFEAQGNYGYSNIISSSKVPKGKVYVGSDMEGYCKNFDCVGTSIKSYISNIYYKDDYKGTISKVIKQKDVARYFGLPSDGDYYNAFFINSSDYKALYDRGNYQISVMVDDIDNVDLVLAELESLNLIPLAMRDVKYNFDSGFNVFFTIFTTAITAFVVLALLMICYFVIWIIMRSRNIYYTTVRILGGGKYLVNNLIIIELFVVANLAFAGMLGALQLAKERLINVEFLISLIENLTTTDYLIIYVFLVLISLFIGNRIAVKLFKDSAMKTYREVV